MVASRVGAIPELVVEGETGFLVPRGDADALAQAVNLLLDESGLYASGWAEAGWQRAREEFDIARNGRRLVDLALRAREEAR